MEEAAINKIRESLDIMNVPVPTRDFDNNPLPPLNFTPLPPRLLAVFITGDRLHGENIYIPEGVRKSEPIMQVIKLPDPEIIKGCWNDVPFLFQFLREGDVFLVKGAAAGIPTSWGEGMPIMTLDHNAVGGFYTNANGSIITEDVSNSWKAKIATEEDRKIGGTLITPPSGLWQPGS